MNAKIKFNRGDDMINPVEKNVIDCQNGDTTDESSFNPQSYVQNEYDKRKLLHNIRCNPRKQSPYFYR